MLNDIGNLLTGLGTLLAGVAALVTAVAKKKPDDGGPDDGGESGINPPTGNHRPAFPACAIA